MNLLNLNQIKQLQSFMAFEKLQSIMQGFFDPDSSGKNSLIQGFENSDVLLALKQAHFIKGSSSFIGMKGIYEYCVYVENELKNTPSPDYSKMILEFESIWANSKIQIEEYLSNISG
jgi:HPt (histidine-containing phosphotransfer) domain-containing protein